MSAGWEVLTKKQEDKTACHVMAAEVNSNL
jgi:hypothetical protein